MARSPRSTTSPGSSRTGRKAGAANVAVRNPTTVKLIWRHAALSIKHTPNYLTDGWSMIESTVIAPKGAPLPITTTGYRSHFLDERELTAAGSPAAYVARWLDHEARGKAWALVEFKWRQGDLFG